MNLGRTHNQNDTLMSYFQNLSPYSPILLSTNSPELCFVIINKRSK